MIQTRNPLSIPYTNDSVAYSCLRTFLGHGLIECWCSHNSKPGDDLTAARPLDLRDVAEVRDHFLNLVEDVALRLWSGRIEPGHGDMDREHESLWMDDSGVVILSWYAHLNDDAMWFDFVVGNTTSTIWLDYSVFEDRAEFVRILTEARAAVDASPNSQTLIESAKNVPAC